MGKYEGELKDNLKTVRLTDTAVRCVEQFPDGTGFNSKLEKLILFHENQDEAIGKKLQLYDELTKDVDKLLEKKRDLTREIKEIKKFSNLLERASKSVSQLYHFVEEREEKPVMQDVKQRIRLSGHKTSRSLEENIVRLDRMTGKENSMSDISKAFKNRLFQEQPEVQMLVDEIGKEFQHQEQQMKIPDADLSIGR